MYLNPWRVHVRVLTKPLVLFDPLLIEAWCWWTSFDNLIRRITYRDICWIQKCYQLQRIWSSTTLSLTLTTNCFAPMLKRKLGRCMMNCDDHLRRFNETLINWHWMSSVKNSCIRGRWLCMTCSNNKIRTLIFVKKKIAQITGMHT